MMQMKMTHFEKVSLRLLVVTTFLLAAWWIAMSWLQGWWEPKVIYHTRLSSADGVYEGLDVFLAGIKVGQVEQVELDDTNEVKVLLSVKKKYQSRLAQGTQIRVIRPTVIGPKAFELTLVDRSGSQAGLDEGAFIPVASTVDVMAYLTGRADGELLNKMSEAFYNIGQLVLVLSQKERLDSVVRGFDQLLPLLENLNRLSKEGAKLASDVNRSKRLTPLLVSLADVSGELQRALPMVREKAPHLMGAFEKLVTNMAVLSEQFQILTPALAEIGPELPQATRRALEALNETVIVLKALQKSFLLESNVEAVKKEERERKRQPAQSP
jgi:phospholipid/cholesterol/gamma-HCH transport system substrate-binding protein